MIEAIKYLYLLCEVEIIGKWFTYEIYFRLKILHACNSIRHSIIALPARQTNPMRKFTPRIDSPI